MMCWTVTNIELPPVCDFVVLVLNNGLKPNRAVDWGCRCHIDQLQHFVQMNVSVTGQAAAKDRTPKPSRRPLYARINTRQFPDWSAYKPKTELQNQAEDHFLPE